jgi:hypothetical protein
MGDGLATPRPVKRSRPSSLFFFFFLFIILIIF